jgi:hypothetical protein
MSTTSKALIALAIMSLLATAARSDGIGSFDNGQSVFGGLWLKPSSGGGGGGACAGAVDASAGCPLPMIGI